MRRKHLVEISDEPWCPRSLRRAATDFCRFVTEMSGAFHPAAPLIARAIRRAGASRVLDLGSGAGGPWLGLRPLLRQAGADVPVCLSDYNPDLQAFERVGRLSRQAITYHPDPVDATRVPAELRGFRTMFSAFHHMRPPQARAVLADAVARGEGIGVFECAERHRPLLLTLAALTTPARVLVTAPFIRPFRWSRLLWTYLLPAFPLVMAWDVVVSCLRVYDVEELRDLTAGLESYHWDIGVLRGRPPLIRITYLIGLPRADVAEGGAGGMPRSHGNSRAECN